LRPGGSWFGAVPFSGDALCPYRFVVWTAAPQAPTSLMCLTRGGAISVRASLCAVAAVALLAGCQYEAPEYRGQGPLLAAWNAEHARLGIAAGPPFGPAGYMQGLALRPIAPPPQPPPCAMYEDLYCPP
jgi:hypothetical protein